MGVTDMCILGNVSSSSYDNWREIFFVYIVQLLAFGNEEL